MCIRRFPVLLVIAWGGFAQAQSTFEKVYLSGANGKMNLIEFPSRNVLAGLAWGPGVSLLDPGGSIIHTEHYWSDSILVQRSIRRSSANVFYFVQGYQEDSCTTSGNLTIPHTCPAIGRTDSLGNVLQMLHYRLNTDKCWTSPDDLAMTSDKGVITWGGDGPGTQWSFYGMRVDSMGLPVWAKSFDRHGSFRFIKELPSGDLLAGFNMDTAGASVARMDADGNFLWCKSYFRPGGKMHDAVIESDSAFIITGLTLVAGQTDLFMLKLNGAGDVQWCRGYDSSPNPWYPGQQSRVERTTENEYVILATLGQPGVVPFYRPFLMKTDENGDTLWTRSMGANDYTYYTKDLLVYSNGGYLISGGLLGHLPHGWSGAPYIFKTDSFGHFSCHERRHPIEVLDLFPVDSSFTLTSVDGATVHPAFVRDTVFDPIAVYDGCTFLPTGMPSIARPSRSMNVRPNPNAGRFTMEFTDPLAADSFYSVYDAVGKLLFQRPLAKGTESEEIDLSRFGKGTYLVRITSKDGVCNERVVVQ
ncbi:MAG TPA: T9SS type A sorting domain-containing protein, partial [Flavobacteriales bacterium]|nr:T9SS type A sorting domain-containing protein [Flavobacteriales bacterium]